MRLRDRLASHFTRRSRDTPQSTAPKDSTQHDTPETIKTPAEEAFKNDTASTIQDDKLENAALNDALQKHSSNLTDEEREAFRKAYSDIAPSVLFQQIKELDSAHSSKSGVRRYAASIDKFFSLVDRFLGVVSIAAQSDISTLVVGGIRCVIDIAKGFLSFFDRLTTMLTRLGDYLGPLAEYAKVTNVRGSYPLIRTALVDVYGDLLDFLAQARKVFLELDGTKRRHISMAVFFESQWNSFEDRFEGIDTQMKHHLDVLTHASGASMIKSEDERRRREFFESISSASHEARHQEIYAKKYPGTGNWLLETPQFVQWLDNPTSTLLWCHGNPGVGKSVLA